MHYMMDVVADFIQNYKTLYFKSKYTLDLFFPELGLIRRDCIFLGCNHLKWLTYISSVLAIRQSNRRQNLLKSPQNVVSFGILFCDGSNSFVKGNHI